MNARIVFFKPVWIMGWWTDTKSSINCNICILDSIYNIQNLGSDNMHSMYATLEYNIEGNQFLRDGNLHLHSVVL